MGQMQWQQETAAQNKILYLRESESEHWKPYTASVHRQPDLQMRGASKGWTTFQYLRDRGWQLISSEEAIRSQTWNDGESDSDWSDRVEQGEYDPTTDTVYY